VVFLKGTWSSHIGVSEGYLDLSRGVSELQALLDCSTLNL
jgi:hypothetical protein